MYNPHDRTLPWPIGTLQGRLTTPNGRGVQFYPAEEGEWRSEFDHAQKAGLDCLELLVRPNSMTQNHPLLSPHGRNLLRVARRETGIRMYSVHAYYEPKEEYKKTLQLIVDSGASIGIGVVLVSFFREKLSFVEDISWERAASYMATGAINAYACGVRIGIEAELPAASIASLIEYLDKRCRTPGVFSSYYDIGNQYARGFPVAEEIRMLSERIAGVHIKDRLPQVAGEKESASVALGHGCANIPEALAALAKVGYRGPLIIQGARKLDGNETRTIRTYASYVRDIINKVERGGHHDARN